MSLIGRHFNWFRNFGPYIVQSTISDELHQILLGTANKIRKNKKLKLKNDYRHKLAGNLSEEYSYSGAFTDKEEFIVDQELRWLASHFTNNHIIKAYIIITYNIDRVNSIYLPHFPNYPNHFFSV